MDSLDEAVSELVSQLNKRKKYFQQIKQLAQKQGSALALAKEDPEVLVGLLETRGRIMTEVDALDAADRGTADFLQSFSAAGKLDASPEALKAAAEIAQLIDEIQTIDRQNLAAASQIREDLRQGLQDISRHRRSRQLYKKEGKSIKGAFINKTR